MKKSALWFAILGALSLTSPLYAEEQQKEEMAAEVEQSAEPAADSQEMMDKSADDSATRTIQTAEGTQVVDAEEGGSSKHWSLTPAFVSDYRFRGISQTNQDPALQLGFNYNFDVGIYAGLWGSNVDFVDGDGANYELDYIVGYNTNLNELFNLDVSATRYNYPRQRSRPRYSYNELVGKLTFNKMFYGLVGFSNDVLNGGENGTYIQLGANVPVAEVYTLSAWIGHYDYGNTFAGNTECAARNLSCKSIVDYSLGVTRAFGPVNASLSYVDTNGNIEPYYGSNNDGRFVFSLSTSF
jgi:uncharacterized protein (TIGR02001 family)